MSDALKEVEEDLAKELGISEHRGFPNAATDTTLTSLDISKLLVNRPISTFFMRFCGVAARGCSVQNGDILVIDRSLQPRPADLVIWWDDESFAVGVSKTIPHDIVCWGVVTFVIKDSHRSNL